MKRKNQKKSSKTNKHSLSPQRIQAILRNLSPEQSFHFYEEVGKPTGQVATNLLDFCNALAAVESPKTQTSLAFHAKRADFAAWIRDTVGDSELADKLAKIDPNNPSLAKSLHETVDTRIRQLKEALIEYSVIPEEQQVIPYDVRRTR